MKAAFPHIEPASPQRVRDKIIVLLLGLVALLGAAAAWPDLARANQTAGSAEVLNYCYQGKLTETRLVVVNKSLQRVMVYRYLGGLVLEYEFPAATGTNQGPKTQEGDERTPVGIYFTTHRYQDRKVTIFGDRAIHLNYPNPVDLIEGKKGNGIYIHGTNQDLRKRSSNGCVTMRNQDLALIEPLITEQLTPVIVVERLELAPLNQREQACDQLRNLEGALDKSSARLEPALALAGNGHEHKGILASLAPKLASLDSAPQASLRSETKGLVLLGLGKQWVLVANQILHGPKRRTVSVTRRFYLNGQQAPEASLVRGDWVVPDLASAKTLASWAPAAPPQGRARQAKPVLASAGGSPAAPGIPQPAAREAAPRSEQQLKGSIKLWLAAWQSKRLKNYMTFYAPGFTGDGKNRNEWRKHKAYLNKVYKDIRVRAENLKISIKGSRAEVSFVQHYRSDWHQDVGKKTMVWQLRKGRWLIIQEDWNSLPGRASGVSGRGSRSS